MTAHVQSPRRWAILAAGTLAQASSAVTIHGAPFLIPALRDDGLSLAEAGLVAAAPTVGVMLALVAWGVVADRRGERFTLLAGVLSTAVAGALAVAAPNPGLLAAALLVAGAGAASTSSASGRVVVGWFPPGQRGLAMGIRQCSQPLGVGAAAISMSALAHEYGVARALVVPVAASLAAAGLVALVVLDPPRPQRSAEATANPYRRDSYLGRVHAAAVLLVVPQFLVWSFALVWLIDERGWSPVVAGSLVAATQLAGAAGRIVSGTISDRVGSRMRPMRWISVVAAATMVGLGLTAGAGWAVSVGLLALATVVTVADNGLAFTAVAERAGPFWSGRALGAHNTAQYLAASAVPPAVGWAVPHAGWATVFAVAACFPAVAAVLVPVADEQPLS